MRNLAVLGTLAATAVLAVLAPAAAATTDPLSCSPTSVVVVGCDQVQPSSETFSPGDLGAYRYESRSPARNVNRLSVHTTSASNAETFELSLWDGTASTASNRLGSCTVTDAQANAWNSCSIPDVWVPAGAVRYIGILYPESRFEAWNYDGEQLWIHTAGQQGGAPEYEHSNRDLDSTPSTFTKGNTYAGASPASFFADDVVDPVVTFTDGPADGSTDTSPSWSWTADEPATFECALDGGAFSACTSPHEASSVAPGEHTFRVRATDAAGNVSDPEQDEFVVGTPTLWIDLDGGDCVRSVAYDDEDACDSLDEAYQEAEDGDQVLIKAGAYPAQETAADNTALTEQLTVKAAPGETVTFEHLETHGDHLHLKDVSIPADHDLGWEHDGGSYVTLENVDVTGPYANVTIVGGDHVTYRDSELGTADNETVRECGVDDGQPMWVGSTDQLTIDRVTFHPFQADDDPVRCNGGVLGLDTLYVEMGNDDLLITGSVFEDGDGANRARIYQGGGFGENTENLVIANSYVGLGAAGDSIRLGQTCLGYRIAYTFWRGGFNDGCSQPNADSLLFIGNLGIMPSYICPGSGDGSRNLWVWYGTGTCGTDEWLATSDPLLDAYEHAADGYHLTPASGAIDAGEALAACDDYTGGVDIDGEPRGATCDAGPDEYIDTSPAGPAVIWMDLDGGDCDRSAPETPYDDEAACGSLNSAYQRARSGDTVLVKAGAYPAQLTQPHGSALDDEPITVQPAEGETVTFDKLTTRGDWLHLKDIAIPTGSHHMRGWYHDGGSHVTLENVDISGPHANIYVVGGEHNSYVESEFGTPGNTIPRVCGSGDNEPMELGSTDHFTVDHVTFHPFQPELGNTETCDDPSGNMHLETVRVNGDVDDLKITNNRFMDGDGSNTARIFVTKLEPAGSGENSDRLIIANNYIGKGGGSVSIFVANHVCTGYVIAYNFWRQAFIDACTQPNTDSLTFIGNLATMPSGNCPGSQDGRKNLWVDDAAGTCGTDDWLIGTKEPEEFDEVMLVEYEHASDGYHLTEGSPAIDAGEDLEDCEEFTGGVDIDGDPRGPTCDAGPDEYTE